MTAIPHQYEEQARESIPVRVLFFGAAREVVGADVVEMHLRSPANAASAFEEIVETYSQLRRFGRSLLVAVNQEYTRGEGPVNAGDEIAIFPPVSGGKATDDAKKQETSAKDFYELTTEPIDVGSCARRIVPSECGATVTLDGYVREWTRGRRTLFLVYEAYEQMALREMERLARDAHSRFEISVIGIIHRTGRLEVGETSVVISVSAPHRRAAFEACEWAIRELKRTVPIWKKEFYEDGEVWVDGEGTVELTEQ